MKNALDFLIIKETDVNKDSPWLAARQLTGDFTVKRAFGILEAPIFAQVTLSRVLQAKQRQDLDLFAESICKFWNDWFCAVKGNVLHNFLEAAALVNGPLPSEDALFELEEKQKACNFLSDYLAKLKDPSVTFLDSMGNYAMDKDGKVTSFLPKIAGERLC